MENRGDAREGGGWSTTTVLLPALGMRCSVCHAKRGRELLFPYRDFLDWVRHLAAVEDARDILFDGGAVIEDGGGVVAAGVGRLHAAVWMAARWGARR